MRFLILALLLGCRTAPEDSALGATPLCEEGYELSWDNFAHGFFLTYCASCHSESSLNRSGAPEGVDFDTEDQVAAWKDVLEEVVLEEEYMPLGGGVFPEDLVLLEIYLGCEL